MATIMRKPRAFSKIMEAISQLKEKQGSSQKQIIEHLARVQTKDNGDQVAVQVRHALQFGLRAGLIKQRNGKYVAGADKNTIRGTIDMLRLRKSRKGGKQGGAKKRQNKRKQAQPRKIQRKRNNKRNRL